MSFLRFESISIILELAFLVNLFRRNLWRNYRWLTLMLAVGLLRDVWLNRFDADDESYQGIWAYTLFPYVLCQIACGSSAYFRLAQLYRGMGRFAGWLYLSAVVIAELSFLFLHQWIKDALYASFVSCCLMLEQSVAITMGGATLLVVLFLARFPNPLKTMPPNLVRHLLMLTGFFTLTGIFQIVMSMTDNETQVRVLEQSYFALGNLCYFLWMMLLRKDGESTEEWLPLDPRRVEQIRVLDAGAIEVADHLNAAFRS